MGRKINSIPGDIYNSSIDGTRECRSEFGQRINLFPLQHIFDFFVLYDQIRSDRKTFMRPLMACLNTSQLDADTVKPNTIAVVRLYNLSTMKTKAPVKSV
jgi:hypothetical protein